MHKKLISTDYEIGQDNLHFFGLDFHNPVFLVSAILTVGFVVLALLYPEAAIANLNATKAWAVQTFDWLFVSTANLLVLFCLALILSPFGSIRIGGAAAKPDFSRISWFAMLFAAGMGIGLMFWSVAEPVAYLTGWWGMPLNIEKNTPEAAQAAMGATMFHWGLHPWAIYAVVGLSLAIFTYNYRLPLTIRSAFYPILGERVWGWPGHIVDTLAVVATIFGLATSLGLGAQQSSAGLSYVFGWEMGGNTLEIIIIVLVTAAAVLSVVRGLDGGVKILSNLNMLLALALLLFVLFAGSTLELVKGFFSTGREYASHFLALSNPIGRTDTTFYHDWTVFYWAWWISWSPFVGMFIARISKGRSVREFLIAVLLVPTAVTVIWMTTFGQSALMQVQGGVGQLANGLGEAPLALFQMIENLPLSSITSLIGIFLVLVFFVTSSDSGSLVVDSITAGGKVDAPVSQRVFWAITEGLVAAALLYGGGTEALEAIQAGAVSAGLPFVFVLLAMMLSLFLGLRKIRRTAKTL